MRACLAGLLLALPGVPTAVASGSHELFVRGRVELAESPHKAAGELILRDGPLGPVVAVLRDPGARIRRILPAVVAFRASIQPERSTDDRPVLQVADQAPGSWHGLHEAIWAPACDPTAFRNFRSIPSPPRKFATDGGGSDGGRDSDGDGVPDAFERAHGSDPDRPDADIDRDRDGSTLLEEFIAGTDPDDPGDALRVGKVEASIDGIVLHWRSVIGRSYRVVVSDTLAAPFNPVPGSETTATSRTSSVVIPLLPGTRHAFFSIEVMLPE